MQTTPTEHPLPACPYCGECHARDRGFSFDGFGINGCDTYRTRLVTFNRVPEFGSPRIAESRQKIGRVFEAAPALLSLAHEFRIYAEKNAPRFDAREEELAHREALLEALNKVLATTLTYDEISEKLKGLA